MRDEGEVDERRRRKKRREVEVVAFERKEREGEVNVERFDCKRG